MVSDDAIEPENENDEVGVTDYELYRQQTIKENLERMQKLGIIELSRNLKPPPKPKTLRPYKPLPLSLTPQRRSSRIQTIAAVDYSEKRVKNEIKTCHQCRQKTIGHHHAQCCKCSTNKIVKEMFCGDCLFMRYGENVLEAKANPDWVCPVCRDICNCSCCRRVKGWESDEHQVEMVNKKKRRHGNDAIEPENGNDEVGVTDYELSREQRIKENLERMQKLGIIELSRNLKPPPKPKTIRPQKPLPLSLTSQRRSSRIPTMPTVNYSQKRVPKSKEKVIKDVKIEIYEGSQPEVYTEEHEKALGDHKEPWTLFVDGYDNEGNRIYDGKRCHQCRKRTPGHYTQCCKCNKKAKGQLCGDCLFKRYGENILEAKENPDWVCPVCRDICNCPRCRKAKGWWGTGDIYTKVLRLGFKSIAHYLIHTRGPKGKLDDMYNKTPYEEDYKSHGLNDDGNDNDNDDDDDEDGSSGEDD